MPPFDPIPEPIDGEERAPIEAVEAEGHVPGPTGLMPEQLDALRVAARATSAEPGTEVSIRPLASDQPGTSISMPASSPKNRR